MEVPKFVDTPDPEHFIQQLDDTLCPLIEDVGSSFMRELAKYLMVRANQVAELETDGIVQNVLEIESPALGHGPVEQVKQLAVRLKQRQVLEIAQFLISLSIRNSDGGNIDVHGFDAHSRSLMSQSAARTRLEQKLNFQAIESGHALPYPRQQHLFGDNGVPKGWKATATRDENGVVYPLD